MRYTSQHGFTLIELVMVIIILGVISYTAVGLFSTRGDFAPTVVRDQVLANLRLAQQTALARQAGDNISLVIQSSGANWQFDFRQGTTSLFIRGTSREGTGIRSSTTDFASACAALPAAPVTIAFDKNGDLNPAGNRRLCITGQFNYELCISAAGFAYEGTCVP